MLIEMREELDDADTQLDQQSAITKASAVEGFTPTPAKTKAAAAGSSSSSSHDVSVTTKQESSQAAHMNDAAKGVTQPMPADSASVVSSTASHAAAQPDQDQPAATPVLPMAAVQSYYDPVGHAAAAATATQQLEPGVKSAVVIQAAVQQTVDEHQQLAATPTAPHAASSTHMQSTLSSQKPRSILKKPGSGKRRDAAAVPDGYHSSQPAAAVHMRADTSACTQPDEGTSRVQFGPGVEYQGQASAQYTPDQPVLCFTVEDPTSVLGADSDGQLGQEYGSLRLMDAAQLPPEAHSALAAAAAADVDASSSADVTDGDGGNEDAANVGVSDDGHQGSNSDQAVVTPQLLPPDALKLWFPSPAEVAMQQDNHQAVQGSCDRHRAAQAICVNPHRELQPRSVAQQVAQSSAANMPSAARPQQQAVSITSTESAPVVDQIGPPAARARHTISKPEQLASGHAQVQAQAAQCERVRKFAPVVRPRRSVQLLTTPPDGVTVIDRRPPKAGGGEGGSHRSAPRSTRAQSASMGKVSQMPPISKAAAAPVLPSSDAMASRGTAELSLAVHQTQAQPDKHADPDEDSDADSEQSEASEQEWYYDDDGNVVEPVRRSAAQHDRTPPSDSDQGSDEEADEGAAAADSDDDTGSSDDDDAYGVKAATPFFGAAPSGFKPHMSHFGAIWTIMNDMTDTPTKQYIHIMQDTKTSADTANPANILGVERPVANASQVQFQAALCEVLGQQLPSIVSALNIKVPASEISKQITGLVKTFRVRGALPALQSKQWQLVLLLVLAALSWHRIPAMQHTFSRQRVDMKLQQLLGRLQQDTDQFFALLDLFELD